MSAQVIGSHPIYSPQTATEAAEARTPEVSREMDNLISVCDVLEKQISSLEVRLLPVVAQRKEGGNDVQKNPEPVRCPLAQSLHERHRHLIALSDQLHSITNRLEV